MSCVVFSSVLNSSSRLLEVYCSSELVLAILRRSGKFSDILRCSELF